MSSPHDNKTDPPASRPEATSAADVQPAGSEAATTLDNGASADGQAQGNKKKQVGRNEWRRLQSDKRKQLNDDWGSKRRRVNDNGDSVDGKANPFSNEEIAAEARRPKKKVAVMIGYSGTGYKGMQINGKEMTIEGDIFKAFIAAGAISKANADDPKKSSLARCARTDKGVHAAGNVISLKLIIEDEDIVEKINANLPEQIRVWGIQRTSNSFSCYSLCDSRWYEYLLPTYCLLPPHPESYLWKKLVQLAKDNNSYDEFQSKYADVAGFWEEVEDKAIKPILEALDPDTRAEVLSRIHVMEETLDLDGSKTAAKEAEPSTTAAPVVTEDAPMTDANPLAEVKPKGKELGPVDFALRDIKAAYVKAKRAYRVTPGRLQMLQDALSQYEGTRNYHNYTVQKSFKDPSSKRHIKSFEVNMNPIQIRDTQWVSLKVHGQSFMMHQIRKMVSMATLLVRAGTPVERINQSFGSDRIAIPKAPGLGLLLERPVFEGYNRKAIDTLGKDPIDFDKYAEKIQAFKDKEIYQRIFEVEETENTFHTFFNQVDNFKSDFFLWLSAGGIEAGAIRTGAAGDASKVADAGLDEEDEDPEGGEG
ncbi:tRNA pseudouridine synthase A [Plectosphaerella plurivora]|uniref:tRNA pseudouridine synthase 1 n=1 Tax=Plectosphaerella plurivora TaxID=936078 RepID=A0A9P9ADR1_9PEZI|nr:tRNA pseudouridine synthase A [Plectosphaerella plurivora]